MLAEAKSNGEDGVHCAHEGPGCRRHKNPHPEISGIIGGRKSGHGREQHDAFDAQIENAGALGQHFAQGGKSERCRNADDGGEEPNLEQLFEDCVHAALSGNRRR